MNIASFFRHWSIVDNPFRAEEARHDTVFAKLGVGPAVHPDFDKICGEFDKPSTSIVFGEKGSGKTAIRLQIEQRLKEYNANRSSGKCLFIPYDDLNPMLDAFYRHSRQKEPGQAFARFRLVDHMDAILHLAVRRLVDGILDKESELHADLGDSPQRRLRKGHVELKRDLLLLQACYDKPETAHDWTQKLALMVRRRRLLRPRFFQVVGIILIVLAAAMMIFWSLARSGTAGISAPAGVAWPWLAGGILAAILGIASIVKYLRNWWQLRMLASQLAANIRVIDRSRESYLRSLINLRSDDLLSASLPVNDSDDVRYNMFERLKRVLAEFGFSTIMVIVDRVDEPTLVNGSVPLMRSIIWPMLNSKFLQQDGIGLKLLLPVELRHELFRESTEFFQEARLDKQNLVERLTWSGATLYDLCNTRLRACSDPSAATAGKTEASSSSSADSTPVSSADVSLSNLFTDDVNRQDIVDALDQMQQPRDAFKLLYQCIQEHCSTVTEEEAAWQIPRLVLENVRRQQAGRVQDLHKGLRPA